MTAFKYHECVSLAGCLSDYNCHVRTSDQLINFTLGNRWIGVSLSLELIHHYTLGLILGIPNRRFRLTTAPSAPTEANQKYPVKFVQALSTTATSNAKQFRTQIRQMSRWLRSNAFHQSRTLPQHGRNPPLTCLTFDIRIRNYKNYITNILIFSSSFCNALKCSIISETCLRIVCSLFIAWLKLDYIGKSISHSVYGLLLYWDREQWSQNGVP